MGNELSIKKLKKQLFFVLSAVIFFFFLLLLSTTIYFQKENSNIKDKKFHALVHATEKHIINHYINTYKKFAKKVVEQKEVKEFIKNRDREGLYNFYKKQWETLQKKDPHFTIFHFHLPDGTSFLRLHKPEKFGDQLNHIRPMMKEIHKNKKTLIGYETGKMSTVFRIIVPIYDKGKYIGALDIGLNPNFLIEKMKEIIGNHGAIFIKKSDIKLFSRESHFEVQGYLLQSKIDTEMMELLNTIDKKNIFQSDYQFNYKEKNYILHVMELKNYLKETKVKIIFFQDITTTIQNRQQILKILIFLTLVVFLVLLFLITKLINSFEIKLEELYKKHSNDLEHLNYVLNIISNVNQDIVKIKDEDLLLKKVCTNLTESHIFDSAWIALYDKNNHFCKVFTQGLKTEATQFKQDLLSNEYKPYCIEHIGQEKVFFIENPSTLCNKCILKNSYTKNSAIILKLEHNGKNYGFMGISAPKTYFYNEKIKTLFNEITNDITFALHNMEMEKQRKSMEKELRQNQKTFKLFMENIPANVIIKDENRRIIYSNSSANHFFAKKDLIGKKTEDFLSKDMAIMYNAFDDKVIKEGIVDEIKEIKLLDNKKFINHIMGFSIPREDDRKQLGLIFIDITENYNTKQELVDKEEIMIAQSRHAAMGEMIGMIAHQWRQPITVIAMGANNLLADLELNEVNDKSIREESRSILKQTEYLSKTIDDFRNFFRPNKEAEETQLENIMIEAKKIIGKSLQHNNITLTVKHENGYKVKTYSRELLQVYINLLKNAKEVLVEKQKKERFIDVTFSHTENHIITTICDNGGGIDVAIIDKIFEPYFSTKDEKTGTGLGLYMSKIIVEKHLHGTLKVSNSDNGACFKVIIPMQWKEK